MAYGFARLRLIGKGFLFGLMLATMAIPPQVTMVPRFALFRALGWYGTILPLTVPSLFGASLYIFLLTQFFRSLPEELAEAARLDGAGEWTTFWRVMLPLSKPALATCALFQFVGTWNDFLGPLIYLNDPEPVHRRLRPPAVHGEERQPVGAPHGGLDPLHHPRRDRVLLRPEELHPGHRDDGRRN